MLGRVVKCELLLILMVNWGAFAHDELWVRPTFPVGEMQHKTVNVGSTFDYKLYAVSNSNSRVIVKERHESSMETIEQAFNARMSAINHLDYGWWLETWESESRNLALAYYQSKGLDQEYWIENWKFNLAGRKIKPMHKIVFQDYIIMTYNVADADGKEGYLELPMVFKHQDNQWLVSLDLRQNPLLLYSPWVNGVSSETVVHE